MNGCPAHAAAGATDDPMLRWLLRTCRHQIAAGRRPVLGLNGPVGAGKTTLSRQLQQGCAAAGVQVAVASIDDAYWPWPERRQRLVGNPFGVTRVPPGSHDPHALLAPIQRWRDAPLSPDTAAAALALPRFDKRLRGGAGDRINDWQGQADVVLIEGWLIGCRPLAEAAIKRSSIFSALDSRAQAWLLQCNRALADYQPLWAAIDGLMVLWPTSWDAPRRWRFQAEARQRRAGGGWMPAAELDQLIKASLESLPAELYQRPVLGMADWVRVLDRRRRCTWQGSGDAWMDRTTQSSSPCSSATG